MSASPKTPDHPASIYVYPSAMLGPYEYVPGLGGAGAEWPWEKAEGWLASGAVTTTPPEPGSRWYIPPEPEA